MKREKAFLEIKDKKVELPILKGTIGPSVLDVSSLYKNTGIFTYDPGFMSTASCESKITFIDGDQGILRYRGYDIENLVERNKNGFLEIVYLLLYGNLPTSDQYSDFESKIFNSSQVIQSVEKVIQYFSRDSHPMSILIACFSALAAVYHDDFEKDVVDSKLSLGILAIAQIPVIVAMVYRHINNQDVVKFDNTLTYTENFINMMFSDGPSYKINEVVSKALDVIFILHADHEQNASTATVRLVGSTGANIFACLSAGVASLWGPAHGGANEAVIDMLMEIQNSGENIQNNIKSFIDKVKEHKDNVRLMGFGHRVYKNYDPRARIMHESCQKVLKSLGVHKDPFLEIATTLEEVALKDQYFTDRKLYPNVDFYSGIILKAIGIPKQMFTTLFALARTAGWVAQWSEMISDSKNKIGRPRQLYTGEAKRSI